MKLRGLPLRPGQAAGVAVGLEGYREGSARELEAGNDPRILLWREGTAAALPAPRFGLVGVVTDARSVSPVAGGISAVPWVGGLALDLVIERDRLRIDGSTGVAVLPDVEETPVVTGFLERRDGKVLLFRRSARVRSFPGLWAGVSGLLEDPTAEAQARREIEEETGLTDVDLRLEATGPVVYVRDAARVYAVHPFRFRVLREEIRMDWEHTEFEWVDPEEMDRRATVPKLGQAWQAVAPLRRTPRIDVDGAREPL